MMWVNAVFNYLITMLAMWIMVSPMQRTVLRVVMALMSVGGITNIYGLFLFQYHQIWPGEIVTNGAIVMVLIWLIIQPLRPLWVAKMSTTTW